MADPFTFHLTGPHAGKTINLGGYQFIDGKYKMPLEGPDRNVQPAAEDAFALATYLGKSYGAVQEGTAAHEKFLQSQAIATLVDVPPLDRMRGGEGIVPKGEAGAPMRNPALDQGGEGATGGQDGTTGGGEEGGELSRAVKGQVRTALTKLDPKNADHWTDGGLPSVAAVRELAGQKEVSRADIAALAPNLTREEAAKVAGSLD